MTPQSARSYTRLAAAVIAVAVIISAALLASSPSRATLTSTSTVTMFVYETVGQSSGAETSAPSTGSLVTDTSTQCTVLGFSLGVLVELTTWEGPVSGADITSQVIASCNGSPSPMVLGVSETSTNSSGWAWTGCSEYQGTCVLTTTYEGVPYSLSIPLTDGVYTDVHYDLSTGNVTVSYCSNTSPCH